MHRQQLISPPIRFSCVEHAMKVMLDGRPQFRPDFAGRVAQRPRMFSADNRAPGVVVQEPAIGSPVDRHGGLGCQADAKDRRRRLKPVDQCQTDARFARRAGTGREQDCIRLHLRDLVECDLVVAEHHRLGAQFAEIVHEVVGEAVVIIDDEEFHEAWLAMQVCISPASFPRRRESRPGRPHTLRHRIDPNGFPPAREWRCENGAITSLPDLGFGRIS